MLGCLDLKVWLVMTVSMRQVSDCPSGCHVHVYEFSEFISLNFSRQFRPADSWELAPIPSSRVQLTRGECPLSITRHPTPTACSKPDDTPVPSKSLAGGSAVGSTGHTSRRCCCMCLLAAPSGPVPSGIHTADATCTSYQPYLSVAGVMRCFQPPMWHARLRLRIISMQIALGQTIDECKSCNFWLALQACEARTDKMSVELGWINLIHKRNSSVALFYGPRGVWKKRAVRDVRQKRGGRGRSMKVAVLRLLIMKNFRRDGVPASLISATAVLDVEAQVPTPESGVLNREATRRFDRCGILKCSKIISFILFLFSFSISFPVSHTTGQKSQDLMEETDSTTHFNPWSTYNNHPIHSITCTCACAGRFMQSQLVDFPYLSCAST
ncbi:putative signal peptide protein [Puccinia sorghi]|uniref:Putative signal peptide protein n=1 Tax=Puccinia sorghi TaxID=27349 RepID=A0A0L6UUG6_9BASI|nr:putative signal peptide protein [Puccinia sorghi]